MGKSQRTSNRFAATPKGFSPRKLRRFAPELHLRFANSQCKRVLTDPFFACCGSFLWRASAQIDAQGLCGDEIAARLGISVHAVREAVEPLRQAGILVEPEDEHGYLPAAALSALSLEQVLSSAPGRQRSADPLTYFFDVPHLSGPQCDYAAGPGSREDRGRMHRTMLWQPLQHSRLGVGG